MKMHLAARAPNEGARLLARWIARDFAGNLEGASARVGASGSFLQRMIDGTMEPGLAMGVALAKRCGVRARDFNRPAEAGWFDGEPVKAVA